MTNVKGDFNRELAMKFNELGVRIVWSASVKSLVIVSMPFLSVKENIHLSIEQMIMRSLTFR